MSGIFGLFDHDGIDGEALKARVPSASHPVALIRAGRYTLGRTHLGVFKQPPLSKAEPGRPVWVSSGYCAMQSLASPGWNQNQIDTIDHFIDEFDHDGLAALNGTFQCVRVSADGHTLTLVNDRFGLMPLFIYERPPVFAFAPDVPLLQELVRASAHDSDFRFALDRATLAEWLEIGLVMGDRTLLHDVTVLPPGSVLTWDGRNSQILRYWRPRFCDENTPYETRERGELLDAALRRSLRRRFAPGKRNCISLSGGLDSRLLLGAAVREGLNVEALTFGPEQSDDHRIASAVATQLGVPHHRFIDRPDAATSYFDLGIRRTGGMANVLDFWGLQHGDRIRETADLLLNGIGGNELLGFLAFDLLRFKIPRDTGYLTHWLIRKLNPGWSQGDVEAIRQALAPDAPTVSERIDAFWDDCPGQSNVAQVYHFYFEEKSRKSNALGVATDDLFVEPVTPFFDYDVADIGLQIPPRQRMLARFYRTFFSTHYRELAAIPYSRTGLPVSASVGHIVTGKFARRVSGGQREYQSVWTKWLPHDVASAVHGRLTGEKTALAEVLPERIIRERVTALMAGDGSATMAVGQLLSLESFLRQFNPSL